MPGEWSIEGSDGQTILGNVHLPAGRPRGVVLVDEGKEACIAAGALPWQERGEAGRDDSEGEEGGDAVDGAFEKGAPPRLLRLKSVIGGVHCLEPLAWGNGSTPGGGPQREKGCYCQIVTMT